MSSVDFGCWELGVSYQVRPTTRLCRIPVAHKACVRGLDIFMRRADWSAPLALQNRRDHSQGICRPAICFTDTLMMLLAAASLHAPDYVLQSTLMLSN